MAGLAPAPVCGMVLADYGAKVIRVDKVEKIVFYLKTFFLDVIRVDKVDKTMFHLK